MRDDQEDASFGIFDDDYDTDEDFLLEQSMVTVGTVPATERDFMRRRREINRKSARKQRQKQQQINNNIRQVSTKFYNRQRITESIIITWCKYKPT